jgi:hypothetical protein
MNVSVLTGKKETGFSKNDMSRYMQVIKGFEEKIMPKGSRKNK